MQSVIRIGSRVSKLAVAQAEFIRQKIERFHPEVKTEIITMKTTGDRILGRSLEQIGGKGLFVKELDQALLNGEIDISVHSLKDMPMEVADELPLVAFSKREDPRDALVLPMGCSERNAALPIGCSSQRRILQLKELYPEAKFKSVRGNVQTRLRKLDGGEYGALVLAAAGLRRLGLENRISRYFETEEMIPAAGQGILAVQGKKGRDYGFLAEYNDAESRAAALCERAFVRELDGGCSSPIAAYAQVKEDRIFLTGLYYKEETGQYRKGGKSGLARDAEYIGRMLAKELRESL